VKVVPDARIAVGEKGAPRPMSPVVWSKPLPGIIRAIQVVDGRLRNADVYYSSAITAGCTGRGKPGERSSFNMLDAILVRLGPVTATRC